MPAFGVTLGVGATKGATVPATRVPRPVPRGVPHPRHGWVPRAVASAVTCISRPQPPPGTATGRHAFLADDFVGWPQSRVRLRVRYAPALLNDLRSPVLTIDVESEVRRRRTRSERHGGRYLQRRCSSRGLLSCLPSRCEGRHRRGAPSVAAKRPNAARRPTNRGGLADDNENEQGMPTRRKGPIDMATLKTILARLSDRADEHKPPSSKRSWSGAGVTEADDRSGVFVRHDASASPAWGDGPAAAQDSDEGGPARRRRWVWRNLVPDPEDPPLLALAAFGFFWDAGWLIAACLVGLVYAQVWRWAQPRVDPCPACDSDPPQTTQAPSGQWGWR
jgi:hypothetical protein